MVDARPIALVAFDIDGTLTDASTWWAGEATGWVQRYSVRDGEAILRLAARMPVLPLSRNQTAAARERISPLRLDARWLGVRDKLEALPQICREYAIEAAGSASSATASTTPWCSRAWAWVAPWPTRTRRRAPPRIAC
ncbi:MAG: hypothetical protein U0168_10145 [Nannocystaceae bacterium]